MTDDLRSLFDDVTGRVVVPPGLLEAAVRGGRARRRYRVAAALAGSALVAVAAWTVVANMRPRSDTPRPAAPDDIDFALVPDEFLGPEPGPDLAGERDLEEARAVTVAFHALVLRMPSYDFDYKGVTADGDSWLVAFSDGGGIDAREASLQEQAEVLTEMISSMVEQRKELRAREKRVRKKSRAAVVVPASIRQIEAQLEELDGYMSTLEERLREDQATDGVFQVVLRVAESEGGLVVEDVETESPQEAALEAVVGYDEPVDGVDSWGADYFGLEFHRVGDHALRAEMYVFWTGPIPGRYEEMCVPEVRDGSGKVVWIGDATRTRYMGAPPNEEMRESALSFGVDYDGPPEGLEMEMDCAWRPSY